MIFKFWGKKVLFFKIEGENKPGIIRICCMYGTNKFVYGSFYTVLCQT